MTNAEGNNGLDRDLDAIAARLESERPVPRAAFRGDLRRRLVARPAGRRLSRRGALALVTAYASSGLALLAIAAIGVAGAGPLAA
jgi:hypothetical protein